jgi:hypothetical protein
VVKNGARFPQLDTVNDLRIAAVSYHGGFSDAAVAYAKEIARREHLHNVLVPYPVCFSRLFQRLSVAIQRGAVSA